MGPPRATFSSPHAGAAEGTRAPREGLHPGRSACLAAESRHEVRAVEGASQGRALRTLSVHVPAVWPPSLLHGVLIIAPSSLPSEPLPRGHVTMLAPLPWSPGKRSTIIYMRMTSNLYILRNPEFPPAQIDRSAHVSVATLGIFPTAPEPARAGLIDALDSQSPPSTSVPPRRCEAPSSAAPPWSPARQLVSRFREMRSPLLTLTCLHPSPVLQPRVPDPCPVSPAPHGHVP